MTGLTPKLSRKIEELIAYEKGRKVDRNVTLLSVDLILSFNQILFTEDFVNQWYNKVPPSNIPNEFCHLDENYSLLQ